MGSLPEVRAPDRGLGVDLVLIMTFKYLKPREDAGYLAPRVGGGGGAWAQSVKNLPVRPGFNLWIGKIPWRRAW